MKTIMVKAVLVTDGENYLIHGSDAETYQEMFKSITPIWTFNPIKETVHCIELAVSIPSDEDVPGVEISQIDDIALDRG